MLVFIQPNRMRVNVDVDEYEVHLQVFQKHVRVDDARRGCVRVRAKCFHSRLRFHPFLVTEKVAPAATALNLSNYQIKILLQLSYFLTILLGDRKLPTISDSRQSVRHKLVLEPP